MIRAIGAVGAVGILVLLELSEILELLEILLMLEIFVLLEFLSSWCCTSYCSFDCRFCSILYIFNGLNYKCYRN